MQGKSSAGKPQQGSTELYPEAHPRHGAITTLPIRATKALPRGASCRARRRCRRALPRRSCARAWSSSCGSWHRRGRRGGRPTGIKNRTRKSINPPRLLPAASQVPTGLGFPSCLCCGKRSLKESLQQWQRFPLPGLSGKSWALKINIGCIHLGRGAGVALTTPPCAISLDVSLFSSWQFFSRRKIRDLAIFARFLVQRWTKSGFQPSIPDHIGITPGICPGKCPGITRRPENGTGPSYRLVEVVVELGSVLHHEGVFTRGRWVAADIGSAQTSDIFWHLQGIGWVWARWRAGQVGPGG